MGWRIGALYWKVDRKCYCVNLTDPQGKRIRKRLSSDRKTADALRAALFEELQRRDGPPRNWLVRDLCNDFLEHVRLNRAPKTFRWYQDFLISFCDSLPAKLSVRDLRTYHVINWLSRKYPEKGNPNTRRGAVSAVKRVFSWATREMEYFDRNPLEALKRPAARPRSVCLTKDQWAALLACMKDDDPFYDFVRFLLLTGCRPQEARIIEARDIRGRFVHFEPGRVPAKPWARDIPLVEEAITLLQKWGQRFPSGPVFRNSRGKPWTPTAIVSRFRRLRKKVSFRVFAYVARHSVATDMAERRVSAALAAAALGHRDPTMFHNVYGRHVEKRQEVLLAAMEQVTGKDDSCEAGA